MDKYTASTVANLIRLAVKLMQVNGRCTDGSRGIHGEMCPAAAVVEAGRTMGFGVMSSPVTKAVYALDDAAKVLPKEEKIDRGLNDLVGYNEFPGRNDKEVFNFMGHVANTLTKPAPKKVLTNA